jgi:hypothetical protein
METVKRILKQFNNGIINIDTAEIKILNLLSSKSSLHRRNLIKLFVKKYEDNIGKAILNDDNSIENKIVALARNEIGYSKNTVNIDIFRVIKVNYEKLIMNE